MRYLLFALAAAVASPASAQPIAATPAAKVTPVTVEYYYRIRWGGQEEFNALYARNHQPVFDEMKRLGFITKVQTVTPFMHMVGPARWDLRVDITYRSAEDAVGEATGYEAKAAEVTKRLYPDKAKFDAEETKRFSLLEEHWDVMVLAK